MFEKGFKEGIEVNQMKRDVFWHSMSKDIEGRTIAISGAVKMERRRQAAVGEEDAREVGGPVVKCCECQGNREP